MAWKAYDLPSPDPADCDPIAVIAERLAGYWDRKLRRYIAMKSGPMTNDALLDLMAELISHKVPRDTIKAVRDMGLRLIELEGAQDEADDPHPEE